MLHYLRNLGRVLVTALPLMLVAGVAGAVLVEFLPWTLLNQVSRVQAFPNSTMLVLAAGYGVLLPVPMAFDVIVCSVLLNAGMPVHIVAALLVTLGSYSVYAWSLLGTTLSWRVAGVAAAAIFATGVFAGAAAGLFGIGTTSTRPTDRPAHEPQGSEAVHAAALAHGPHGQRLAKNGCAPPGADAAPHRGRSRALVRR